MSALVAYAWKRYLRELQQQPLRTKALTAAFLSSLSDLIAQELTKGAEQRLDLRRALLMAAFGFFWSGPSTHCWQLLLETWVPYLFGQGAASSQPTKQVQLTMSKMYSSKQLLKKLEQSYVQRTGCKGSRGGAEAMLAVKVVADQVCFGPLANLAAMLFIQCAVEGKPLAQSLRAIRGNFWRLQLNSWKVWPLASLVSFKYVPENLRVLFSSLVRLAWQVFLIIRTKQAKQLASS